MFSLKVRKVRRKEEFKDSMPYVSDIYILCYKAIHKSL